MLRIILGIILYTSSIYALSYGRFSADLRLSKLGGDTVVGFYDPSTNEPTSELSLGGGLSFSTGYEYYFSRIYSLRSSIMVNLGSISEGSDKFSSNSISTELVPYFNYSDYVQFGIGLNLDYNHSVSYSHSDYDGSLSYMKFSPSLGLMADIRFHTKPASNTRYYYYAGMSLYKQNYKLKEYQEQDVTHLEEVKVDGSKASFYLGMIY